MMGWSDGFGGMGVVGGLLMVLVGVAVLVLVVWAVRVLFPGTHGTD
jgi:hypothetical protein